MKATARLSAAAAAWLLAGAAWARTAPELPTDPDPATAVEPTDSPSPPVVEPTGAQPAPAPPQPASPTTAEALGPRPTDASAIDGRLPSGVRVIVAQDRTLPVAAVVLAVETGTEDDPNDQLGLVRALAYHVLQGNREHAPGGAAAMVHDAGGVTTLAVGPAQVRYESVVPISRLSQTIEVEAHRLRAATVTKELWADTLRWTRRDRPRKWGSHLDAIAAAHQTPALAKGGVTDLTALTVLEPPAVANALASRFTYTRATLTIVAPADPAETWTAVTEAFADLPPAVRGTTQRTTSVATSESTGTPRRLPLDPASGELFLWPVPATPEAIARATVWCKALNRQRRVEPEPKRARVRCHLDIDPRRATLTVRASGSEDPTALLRGRIDRLRGGTDDPLLQAQRDATRRGERMELRLPLSLARRLAQAGPSPADITAAWRGLDELTGVDALEEDDDCRPDDRLSLASALQIVPIGKGETASR